MRRLVSRLLDRLFPIGIDPDVDDRGVGDPVRGESRAEPEDCGFGTSVRDWESDLRRERLATIDALRIAASFEHRHTELRAALACIAGGKPAAELEPRVAQHHLDLVQRSARLAVADDERTAEAAKR